jgi:hypothetical protein
LRNHVRPDAYARAHKQARAASQRVVRQAEDAPSSRAPVGRSTEQSKLDFES